MRIFILGLALALNGKTGGFEIPDLPVPITNNAVAAVVREGRLEIFSFLGLGVGKTWRDTTNSAWRWREGDTAWHELPNVPVEVGRLASSAVTVGGKIYLFGGYTVDEKGGEVSTPEVFCFDPSTRSYTPMAPMPIPVDDSVAGVYADRFVFLVSGWHNVANSEAVQIYDTQTDTWQRATDFPGVPVFGHAGGIAGNSLIISGGVRVLAQPVNGVKYAAVDDCWLGKIDPADVTHVNWQRLAREGHQPLYRAAAGASGGQLVFAGGSRRPYNYNGIGYDKLPSDPEAHVSVYDPSTASWTDATMSKNSQTMDHRGLIEHNGWFYIVGGMIHDQIVTARVTRFSLPNPKP